MDGVEESSEGFDYSTKVNKPELKDGMIPITYNESGSKWVVADKDNTNKTIIGKGMLHVYPILPLIGNNKILKEISEFINK